MSMIDKMVSRTTGTGIVMGLSVVSGAVVGLIIFFLDDMKNPGMILGGALLAPIAALVFGSPLRKIIQMHWIMAWVFLPLTILYWIAVWPASKIALKKGWIEEV